MVSLDNVVIGKDIDPPMCRVDCGFVSPIPVSPFSLIFKPG